MGTITTCVGASLGGQTRPLSSLWLMIRPPMSSVETPTDVLHTNYSHTAAVWTVPLSSPLTLSATPVSPVQTPHDFPHTNSSPPSAVWYCTLNALAKFC